MSAAGLNWLQDKEKSYTIENNFPKHAQSITKYSMKNYHTMQHGVA